MRCITIILSRRYYLCFHQWLSSVLFVIIILFAPSISRAQLTFPITKGYDSTAWASIQQQVPQSAVMKFVNTYLDNFKPYGTKDEYSPTIADLIKCLHFIDINNDGLADVIFEGRGTAEGNRIVIYINDGHTYNYVFETRQGVRKIDWENNRMKRIYIDDWGCCADYVEFKKIYNVEFDAKNIPVFKVVYQAASMFNGRQPDSAFNRPIRFSVMNDNYNLRAMPVIDDTSFEPWQEDKDADTQPKNFGNVIGIISPGATGTAVAYHTDATGREWWYVEMDEQYPLKQSRFYENDDVKFPTKKMGWISSRFVERL